MLSSSGSTGKRRPPVPCSFPKCPALVHGGASRCPTHWKPRKWPSKYNRPQYSGSWTADAKRTVDAWIAKNGNICPGYGMQAHESHDLTCDHIVAVVNGGTNEPSNRTVLCRGCNSRKAAADKKKRLERKS